MKLVKLSTIYNGNVLVNPNLITIMYDLKDVTRIHFADGESVEVKLPLHETSKILGID